MVKMYSLYKLFELKFSGKTSEEKYAASLRTKAKQIFFLISAITLKICQKHTVLHTVQINFHTVDVNKYRYIQTPIGLLIF